MDEHFLNLMKTKLTDQKTQQIPSRINMSKAMTEYINIKLLKPIIDEES